MSDVKEIKEGETAVTINSTVPSVPEAKAAVKPNEQIIALASNPDVSIEKLEAFINLMNLVESREAEKEFKAAMSRVQSNIQAVIKNCKNSHTRSSYADIGAIRREVMPIYAAEGLSLSFSEDKPEKEKHVKVTAILSHRNGHDERYSKEMPYDGAGSQGNTNKTAIQAHASTLTYIKRYLMDDIFNIPQVDEKDIDGNSIVAYVSEEQHNEIDSFIVDNKIDKRAFIKYAKEAWGANNLGEIPAHKYKWVMSTLRKKVEK